MDQTTIIPNKGRGLSAFPGPQSVSRFVTPLGRFGTRRVQDEYVREFERLSLHNQTHGVHVLWKGPSEPLVPGRRDP